MKRIFCVFLSVMILMTSLASPAFARAEKALSEITVSSVKTMNVSELTTAARNARTDEEAQIVFDEFVSRTSSVSDKSSSMYAPRSAIIDAYLRVISCATSYRSIVLNYEVLAIVPSGAYLTIGYDYPEVTRTNGERITIGSTKGTFTKTITTKGLMCGVRVNAKITARDFMDTKTIKNYMDAPSGRKTVYHTVTVGEALGSFAVSTIGGFALTAVLKDCKYTLVPIAAAACTYFLDAATVVNINLGIPTPVAGQYYKVVTYYSNYKAYVETTIWNNKNAYDVGADPIYSGTVSTPLVQP